MDDFMAAHPNAGAIGINSLIFGSSHHEKKPEGGVLENFTMCAKEDFGWNRFFKTICDPTRVLFQNVHSSVCKRGYEFLDENGEFIMSAEISIYLHSDKIRINHYYCKSREEFMAKSARGRAYNGGPKPMSNFYEQDRNDLIDTEILSLI